MTAEINFNNKLTEKVKGRKAEKRKGRKRQSQIPFEDFG
jgi:hypothetical protein